VIRSNDLQAQWREIEADACAVFERVGSSGWYILGQEVQSFERALAEWWGLPHAVGVGSGLDALEIALRGLGLEPGDRVLTTPLSAFATTLAILRAGGIPVFVDVDARGLLDLDLAETVLRQQRTIRWLLPVHLYGHALDLDRLEFLRRDLDLVIIEDCAQAIGARWRGRAVGTVGQAAAVSFYPTKNLGALGDGGALLTADPQLAARARRLRHYGQSATYVHDELGLNSRLDELHAALLSQVLLPRLSLWTVRRREIAGLYRVGIKHPGVEIPPLEPHSDSVWHLFPILVPAVRRDALRRHLREANIESGVHYPTPIPAQTVLLTSGRFDTVGSLQRARLFAAGEVSLPIHPFLTDDDVQHIAETISAWDPEC
jgi:dTDP-4-amino-4,6-dideoxygalactose transaminase